MSNLLRATWALEPKVIAPWLRPGLGTSVAKRTGEMLYQQGDVSAYFYLVVSGLIQVTIFREDGTEFLLELMGPDCFCGEAPVFDGGPRFSTAIALERSEFLMYHREHILEAIEMDPALASSLVHVLAIKQRVLAARLEGIAQTSPRRRLAELLLRISNADHASNSPTTVKIRLTHEQIASMTGLSRVTVTRAMASLELDGALERTGATMVIMPARMVQVFSE